jgi:hypothetical protein
MTDTVAVQIAQAAETLFAVIGSIASAWFAYRAKTNSQRNSGHIAEVKQDMEEVKRQTNHITDNLAAARERAGRAEGKAEGRAEEKAEQKEEDNPPK